MQRLPIRRSLFPALLPLLACVGCARLETTFGEAKAYSARERNVDWKADDKSRLMLREMGAPGMGMPGGAPTAMQDGPPSFSATIPEGWEQLPPRQFRDASWKVTGTDAECALLASVRGGLQGNADRWCQQFGVPNLTPEQLAAAPKIDLLGKPGRIVELVGTFNGKPDSMLLGVITEADPQSTLKFTGSKDTVTKNRDKFFALCKSIKVGAAGAAPTPNGAGGEPPAAEAPTGFTADLPKGWSQLPSQPASFKDAIFASPDGAECFLTAAVGGGTRMNLDRWAQQFGTEPVTDAQLAAAPTVAVLGKPAHLVELQGTFKGKADQAMLGLITDGEVVTTLKFLGPKAVIAAEKANFLQLAPTVRPGQGKVAAAPKAAPPPAAPVTPPVGHGGAPSAPAFAATIPAGWTRKEGSSKELHHTFGQDGEVYVSGLGGDLRQILDIWRGEMGTQPFTDAEFQALPKLPLFGGDGVLMDVAGNFESMSGKKIEGARMLVGARTVDGSILFVKLFGAKNDVDAQVDAFKTFCNTLRRNQ